MVEGGMKIVEEGSQVRVTWEIKDEDDVDRARRYFTKLTNQGWIAATRNDEYKRILVFQPQLGELWFIPMAEGG
jgi:hypothetical protein